LAQIAQKLNLRKKIINSSDLLSPSILANTVEAIIGAIYLDQGLTAAKKFIQEHLFPRLDKIIKDKLFVDPKSDLQEKAQAQNYPTPAYRTLKTIGPDHNKTFTVEVLVNRQKLGKGIGKSLKQAETNAAKAALTKL
jgi:ribonuclease-3